MGRGWEATVRVERKRATAATADRAWSLLSSPLAWSARARPSMAFDPAWSVSPAGDSERMWFYLAAASGKVVAGVLHAHAVVPGELLRVGPPGGQAAWELSVGSGRRGTVLCAAAIRTVSRQAKIDAEVLLRDDLDAWLAALAAIVEDRQPWPNEGIPPALRDACLASQFTGSMVEASASVNVEAPADKVGRAVASPDVLRAAQAEGLRACGYVPGTPVGEVGGLRYFVFQRGEKLAGITSLLAAVSPTGVIARQITPPHGETTWSWAAAPDSTRLDLTLRVPGSEAAMSDERRQAIQARATGSATRFKAAIESWRG